MHETVHGDLEDREIPYQLLRRGTVAAAEARQENIPNPDDPAPESVLTCRRRIRPPLTLDLLTGKTALPMPLLLHHCEQIAAMVA